MEPEVGLKFRHKILDGHPLCEVVWIDGNLVFVRVDDTAVRAGGFYTAYISEFPHIVAEEDNAKAEDPVEDAVVPRTSGPSSSRRKRTGGNTRSKTANRTTPSVPGDS